MSRAIAIDGPAASGKSSVARVLSEKLNLVMVNSGDMYRAVTWKMLDMGVLIQDSASIEDVMSSIQLECKVDDTGRLSTVGFDGKVLGDELRSGQVNEAVSHVAKVPSVREVLVNKQREYLKNYDVVMEGRDIGTIVFPDTPFKFFFKASPHIREARRLAEGITDSIAARDKQDSSRKTAPLKPADDAIIIDTGNFDLNGVVQEVQKHLKVMGW